MYRSSFTALGYDSADTDGLLGIEKYALRDHQATVVLTVCTHLRQIYIKVSVYYYHIMSLTTSINNIE